MDAATVLNPDCSSLPFNNEHGTIDQPATFDSILTKEALSELEDWSWNWQQNGLYISENSSSEVSLLLDLSGACPGSPVGSNSSWTEEDDNGSLFFEIEQRLRSFVLAEHQTDLAIPPLNSQQRRVVHGMAHLMHLGHKSCKNEGKLCRMHIFKKTNSVPLLSKIPNQTTLEAYSLPQVDYGKLPLLECTKSAPASFQGSKSLSRGFEYRIRLPKRESGFPCRFSDCLRMFDRSCDRRKHEKRHEPKESHPYPCTVESCDKTFMYPKDLRRHERVHVRKAGRSTGVDGSSTDEVFSDASTGSFSESPSLTTSASSTNSRSSLFLPGSASDEDLTPMPRFGQGCFFLDSDKDSFMNLGDH